MPLFKTKSSPKESSGSPSGGSQQSKAVCKKDKKGKKADSVPENDPFMTKFRETRGASHEFVSSLEYICNHAVEFGEGVFRVSVLPKNDQVQQEILNCVMSGNLPAYDSYSARGYKIPVDAAVLYVKQYLIAMKPSMFKADGLMEIAIADDEATKKQLVKNTIKALEDSYQRVFYVLCEFFRKMEHKPISDVTQMDTKKILKILTVHLVQEDESVKLSEDTMKQDPMKRYWETKKLFDDIYEPALTSIFILMAQLAH